VRTALLGRPLDRVGVVLRQALAAGHDEMHPHVLPLLADTGVVRAAHACGVAVVPWTVNRRREVRRLAKAGVDGVITDVPALVRAAPVASPAVA
jgi:glycerophosphoryl diester phosphodiesterase